MFLGLQLLFLLIISPVILGVFILGIINRNNLIGKSILATYFVLTLLLGLLIIVGVLARKKELTKHDYYGEYTIDRNYFSGKQSDWQYNHFRFEITENDSIFFYVTEKRNIIKTYKGTIKTTNPKNYRSERLIIQMEQPTHHILTTNPTIYREAWDFFLVFNSPKFNNMYFRKGEWRKINE